LQSLRLGHDSAIRVMFYFLEKSSSPYRTCDSRLKRFITYVVNLLLLQTVMAADVDNDVINNNYL